MERALLPKEKACDHVQVPDAAQGVSYSNNMFGSSSENIMGFDSTMMLLNSNSGIDPLIFSFGVPPSQQVLYAPLDGFFPADQFPVLFGGNDDDPSNAAAGNSFEKMTHHHAISPPCVPTSFTPEANAVSGRASFASYAGSSHVPHSLPLLIDEKMLRALSLLKERYGGGILAQVWVPFAKGDQYLLTTSEQPYLLDQTLAGFREISRTYCFSAGIKRELPPGLPGRVFVSKIPEWTSNIIYYRDGEYLRVKHAFSHDVRGCIAFPVIDPADQSCCAVLEIAYVKEKSDIQADLDNVSSALSAVNLTTNSPPRLIRQRLSENQTAALEEISDVLRAVCHAHRLPLALTWIPCFYNEEAIDETQKVQLRDGNSTHKGKSILCIEKTACYVNDKKVEGFVDACYDHFIEEGQGIAGRALSSNHPYFFADVKSYDISEYPLVHHARKYGLQAAVAIKLRSTFTGRHDYILEFFLPVNIAGSMEQQHLLNNLSGTMQKICKGLRTVSDSELACEEDTVMESQLSQMILAQDQNLASDKQVANRQRKLPERKKNAAEKTVSLSCLRQYFSGSLKDAAKSIGVCPTTLKRICRQHGIARWPSRKINKVNRSLRKIQNVLDSVQGVEGGLKFDPSSGGFVPASTSENVLAGDDERKTSVKFEGEEETTTKAEGEEGIVEHEQPTCSSMTDSSNGSGSMLAGSPASSQSMERRKSREEGGCSRSQIAVKARYKEDMVRFRFEAGGGCGELYEEVGRRYKLQKGAFQLKYLDDEDEWVMLVTESDLQECLEIIELTGKRSLKLMVRDTATVNI